MSESSIWKIWNRIESWLESNAPEIFIALPEGASTTEIEELESKVGIRLPNYVRESYLIHNGSSDRSLFNAGTLRSLEQMYDEWEIQEDLWGDGENSEWADPPKEIQKLWFSPKWIPFTDSWTGDSLCIDCDPSEHGVNCQVIDWIHTQGPVSVVANSFLEWLQTFTDELEANEFVVQENQVGQQYLVRKTWLQENEK